MSRRGGRRRRFRCRRKVSAEISPSPEALLTAAPRLSLSRRRDAKDANVAGHLPHVRAEIHAARVMMPGIEADERFRPGRI